MDKEQEILNNFTKSLIKLSKKLNISIVTPSTEIDEIFFKPKPKSISFEDICTSDTLINYCDWQK